MALVTLAVVVIMFIVSLVSNSRLNEHKTVLGQNQTTYESNLQQLEVLQGNIRTYTEQTDSITELEVLKTKLFEKQAMLNQLQRESANQSSGFLTVLSSLSEQHLTQIWLKEFSILRGGQAITIQGSSTQPKFIPEYIDSLSQSVNFKGKQFSIFEMKQPDAVSNSYDFKLTSSPDKGSKKWYLIALIRSLTDKLDYQLNQLIPPTEITEFLRSLLTHTTNLKILAINNEPVREINAINAQSNPNENNTPALYEHATVIELSGEYQQLYDYLQALENSQWHLLWDTLHYKVTDYPKANITLRVRTISTDEHWLGL